MQNRPSTPDQRRKNARKAGAARAEKEAVRITLRDALIARLSQDGNQDAIIDAILLQCREGNVKAFEVVRDTIGEKPRDRVEQSGTLRIELGEGLEGLAE